MTQALLNNLNINTGFIQKNETSQNDGVFDFAKILESKTDESQTAATTTESREAQTLGDLKEDNLIISEFNDLSSNPEISAVITDIATELSETTDEEAEEDKEENTEEQDKNSEDTNPDNDTTVTKEDLPVENELTTLENSTAAVILHPQIKNNFDKTDDITSGTETKTEDTISFNSGSKNSLFKNFETISTTKDTTVNLSNNEPKAQIEKSTQNLDENIVKELDVRVDDSSDTESGGEDIMQRQSPQEQAAKVMLQADIKYDKIQLDTIKAQDIKPTEVSAGKIIEQITKQLNGMYNNSKLDIILNPENLGKVSLHLVNTKDGLTAQFTVTNQDAKSILLKGLDGLKESLLSQGVNVNNIIVKHSESAEYQFDWTEQEGSRGGNKQGFQKHHQKDENEQNSFEQMMFELNNDDKV